MNSCYCMETSGVMTTTTLTPPPLLLFTPHSISSSDHIRGGVRRPVYSCLFRLEFDSVAVLDHFNWGGQAGASCTVRWVSNGCLKKKNDSKN